MINIGRAQRTFAALPIDTCRSLKASSQANNKPPKHTTILLPNGDDSAADSFNSRRQAIAALTALPFAIIAPQSYAVQGLTAGRIPGVTGPDKDGNYLYTRPEGKSGGHGVGWSEIPRYSFKIAEGWEEVPVSIADLGGTEIDLKYAKEDAGSFGIVVAPVLRFVDVGYNADIRINELGPPEKIIAGFSPELFGKPLDEGDVIVTEQETHDGVPYYYWEVKPHHLVTATAVGNRLFMFYSTSLSRQWRKGEKDLRMTQKSFKVPPK